VETAGRVHSQGFDGNEWCLVAVPSYVVTPEVTGALGSASSWTPSGGGSHPTLEAEMAMVVFPHHP